MFKSLATLLAVCLSGKMINALCRTYTDLDPFSALTANAQEVAISQQCPYPGLCFQLNIPDAASQSGRGDIYFQIDARTQYQWVALGQGRQMADANMFVLYANGAGNNVSLSTRQGQAHGQPPYSDHAQITLLEGSEINNGFMKANVRCSNCDRWPGGSMDFRGDQADWIFAAKLGEPLRSDDLHRAIHRHDGSGHFSWSFREAKGGNELNPFLTQAATTSQGQSSQGGSSTQQPIVFNGNRSTRLAVIHGGLAALVFVILFPVGGILIRLANFRGGMWVHVGVQLLAWLAAITAFGLGLYLAVNKSLFDAAHAHPIIGIILMILVLGQPAYGWLQHRAYKAHGRRVIWSWAHLSIGRIAIFGGMINGGLGLQLAGRAIRYYVLRYSIVCGVFALLYIAAIIYGELRLRKVSPGKRSFRRMAAKDKENTLLYARSDEQGLGVPMAQWPFRLRRDDALHQGSDSTEYVPLAGRELYADDAGSRAGSRAASPAPRSRAASPETRSRAASATRPMMNTAYDP